jgi:hypothetical protein
VTPRFTLIVVFLALLAIAGGVVSWREHQALLDLRAATERQLAAERDAWQKKLIEIERMKNDLENQLASVGPRLPGESGFDPEAITPAPPQAGRGDRRNRGPGGDNGGGFRALMEDPKFVSLQASLQKASLDDRYSALFKNLAQNQNLTPQQIDAFKSLLVDKQNARRDVMATARQQGVTDRDEINALVKNAQSEVDAQIQAQLGPAGYAQYQQYEQTLPQRNTVNQLSQRLSYSGAPLSDSQSQQLVQILADTASKPNSTKQIDRASAVAAGNRGQNTTFAGSAQITADAITRAQTILAPNQVQALTALQQQQQNQQQLIQMLRATRSNTGGVNGTTPSSPTPAPTAPKKSG